MPPIDISGVKVEFPFVPYPCQVDYMTKLIECLQRGVNGILESPTGTGKTLCLLCATLGWLEDMKAQVQLKNLQGRQLLKDTDPSDIYNDELMEKLAEATGGWEGRTVAPKIIYASRTHSQLSQAMQELKRTQYSSVKASVLGSREQLCIHPQVSKETNNSTKVHMCRAKVTARTCHFYNNIDNMKHNFTGKVLDIEDLGKLGEKHKCCPYYTTRELKQEADVIFMPYNYLLDPKSRRAHGVELSGNIIIFDEAHNLEKMCEDSVSFDLTSRDLASAIEETKELCIRMVELAKDEIDSEQLTDQLDDGATSAACDFTLTQAMEIKSTLINLEKVIDELEVPSKGLTKPGHFIFELFEKIDLRFENKRYFLEVVDKILNHVTNEGTSRFLTKGNGITKIADIVKIVFSRDPDESATVSTHQFKLAKAYKVHVAKEVKDKKNNRKDLWTSAPNSDKIGHTLSYWCFSPGHSMEDLRTHGVKAIILTSGTLSPIESFGMEMGIEFPVTLQNPHIIQEHQIFVSAITKGPDNNKLLSNYENRSTNEYRQSLGNAVVNFARAVPNGLLIFFPSYPVMTSCVEYWQQTNIFNRITQYKAFFVEPRTKPEFHQTMETFYEKINDSSLNGAIFAAVCRGKVSEGLDFADINGRAVVITGLPFPPMMDPKIVLKMAYLDENKNKNNRKTLLGREWYRQQASRAVNQAIGRVIRHKDDYGAILLCDERFATKESKSQLPAWVQPHLKTISTFGVVMRDLMQFFKAAEIALPSPVLKPQKIRATPGCQGASFMPTQTRSTSSPRPPGAGNIESHVASLRHRGSSSQEAMLSRAEESRADSIARLSIQYEMTAPKRPALKGKKRGLLDALESHTTPDFENNKIASPMVSSSQSALERRMEQQKKNRKTMKIKDSSCVKAEVKTAATDYVQKVKSILSTDSYKIFHRAMVEYVSKLNFDNLISTLAALFTEDLNKMELFRGFYQYVKPQHKEQFCEVCVNITGSAPEGSKRSNINMKTSAHNPEKRRKLNQDSGKFSDVKTSRIAAATSCGYQSEVLGSVDKKESLGEWCDQSKKPQGNLMKTLFGTGRDSVDGILGSGSDDNSQVSKQTDGANLNSKSAKRISSEQLERGTSGSGVKNATGMCSKGNLGKVTSSVDTVSSDKNAQTSMSDCLIKNPSRLTNINAQATTKSLSVSNVSSSCKKSKTSVLGIHGKDTSTNIVAETGDRIHSRVNTSESKQPVIACKEKESSLTTNKIPKDLKKKTSASLPGKTLDENRNETSTLTTAEDSGLAAGRSKSLPATLTETKETVVSNTGIQPMTSSAAVELTCGACKKEATAPLKAQSCGHICCFPCWKKIFTEPSQTAAPKVCPRCGKPVKRKDLAKVKL